MQEGADVMGQQGMFIEQNDRMTIRSDYRNNKGKRLRTVVMVAAAVLLLFSSIASIAWIYVSGVLDKIDYEPDSQIDISYSDIEDEEGLIEGVEYIVQEEEELAGSIDSMMVDENSLYYQEGTTNILLLGVDSRKSGARCRSDAIILLSVNRNREEITMTSIMRDTAVAFDARGFVDKLTHGYAYGGAPLVKRTVEKCFGIKIDRYVAIDFYAFIDAVDYLGGIEVDITESERIVINNYVQEINKNQGMQEDDGKLWDTGEGILLTGKQTLGYVRNRYSGGTADFGRTERQRIVLEKIFDKIKENPTKMIGLLDLIAPRITTDYDKLALASEALKVTEYGQYEVQQSRVPADGTWYYCSVDGRSLVACDYSANQKVILETVYGISE